MTKDTRVHLAQMLERIHRIERYTADGHRAFLDDEMIQDAVVRNLEVIGEAAKRVPDELRAQRPEIPWKSIAGLRDVLIHQYEGVSLPEVWRVVEDDLPGLRREIESMIPPLEELERELANPQSDET